MKKLTTIVVAGVAALAVTGAVLAAVGAAPVDLPKTNPFGDDQALAKSRTYRASLFPLAINVRPTDGLWRGDQWVEKNGLIEGTHRTGGTYAYVQLHHQYGHRPAGEISTWGLGLLTIETGVAPTPSVQATMQRLRAHLSDVSAGEVKRVRVAGFSGLSFDGRLKDGAGVSHRFVPFSSSDGSEPSTDSYLIGATYGKGGAFRIDVIDVHGKTVVIYFDSFTAPAARFPVFLGFADKILSTLTFAHA